MNVLFSISEEWKYSAEEKKVVRVGALYGDRWTSQGNGMEAFGNFIIICCPSSACVPLLFYLLHIPIMSLSSKFPHPSRASSPTFIRSTCLLFSISHLPFIISIPLHRSSSLKASLIYSVTQEECLFSEGKKNTPGSCIGPQGELFTP